MTLPLHTENKTFSTSAASEALIGPLDKMLCVELTRQSLPSQEAQTEEASLEQPRLWETREAPHEEEPSGTFHLLGAVLSSLGNTTLTKESCLLNPKSARTV